MLACLNEFLLMANGWTMSLWDVGLESVKMEVRWRLLHPRSVATHLIRLIRSKPIRPVGGCLPRPGTGNGSPRRQATRHRKILSATPLPTTADRRIQHMALSSRPIP
jgi:hypothetical protein